MSSQLPEPYRRSVSIYGSHTEGMPLPFYRQTPLPIPPEEVPPYPAAAFEGCGWKTIQGVAIGAIAGAGFGLIMSALGGDTSGVRIWKGKEVPQAPLREQLRAGVKWTGGRMKTLAGQFAVISALFGGVECVIEKYRAKHDVWNSVASGCIVGGTLGAPSGPTGACAGCLGFAGFSLLADKLME